MIIGRPIPICYLKPHAFDSDLRFYFCLRVSRAAQKQQLGEEIQPFFCFVFSCRDL